MIPKGCADVPGTHNHMACFNHSQAQGSSLHLRRCIGLLYFQQGDSVSLTAYCTLPCRIPQPSDLFLWAVFEDRLFIVQEAHSSPFTSVGTCRGKFHCALRCANGTLAAFKHHQRWSLRTQTLKEKEKNK